MVYATAFYGANYAGLNEPVPRKWDASKIWI